MDDIYEIELPMEAESQFKVFTEKSLSRIEPFKKLPKRKQIEIEVCTRILPFRLNNYVIKNLIDWRNWHSDPMFRMLVPSKEMFRSDVYQALESAYLNSDKDAFADLVEQVRERMNPHPAGQMTLNVPQLADSDVVGTQHKYQNTVLFFPRQGQMCHSYCSFCFRWPQFTGDKSLMFAARELSQLEDYIRTKPKVTDILITGGDPLVMSATKLRYYIEPILQNVGFRHVRNIRIGTKSLSFWPYRFVTDRDKDELLSVFSDVVNSGRSLSIMFHCNHPKELKSKVIRKAISNIKQTGAVIRSQAPLLKGVNDDPSIWATMWEEQVSLGIVPYYMFIERDTGPKEFFSIPLAEAYRIFTEAKRRVSGLARTARGPSMSAKIGKVSVEGIATIHGEKVFVLKLVQCRNELLTNIPFFASYSETATWIDDLEPAFGKSFFLVEGLF